ncbi:MAG: 3-oxoacyl-[acyl-carrier-protein] reductase [Eubacterium sp.]|nr:3-oxoacyl-[acyl-carrier-protein] reductase [Eubacterium sp.]
MKFEGRCVMITGATRGIGKATALAFAKEGADLVITYASSEKAAKVVKDECEALGAKVLCLKSDVSKEDDVKALFETAVEEFGKVDVLVNNAGITKDNILLRMKTEEFDDVIETNLKGSFLCMRAASKIMLKKRYGRIVNLSSVVGVRGNAGQLNYSASKAGVIGMTKSLAKELAAKNISVNAVAPGMIETDMTAAMTDSAKEEMKKMIPAKRMGTPEDIAHTILFLAEEGSGYITGQVLCVDGGMAV